MSRGTTDAETSRTARLAILEPSHPACDRPSRAVALESDAMMGLVRRDGLSAAISRAPRFAAANRHRPFTSCRASAACQQQLPRLPPFRLKTGHREPARTLTMQSWQWRQRTTH